MMPASGQPQSAAPANTTSGSGSMGHPIVITELPASGAALASTGASTGTAPSAGGFDTKTPAPASTGTASAPASSATIAPAPFTKFTVGATEGEVRINVNPHADPNKQGWAFVLADLKLNAKSKPKHLIFVLDRSSSMSHGQLDLLKTATKKVIASIDQKNDLVSIITFDANATIVCQRMQPAQALAKIDGITIGLGTDISAGLLAITLKLVKPETQETTIVPLLTDAIGEGLQISKYNAGSTIEMLRKQLNGFLPRIIPVGLGEWCVTETLRQYGAATKFPFYCVKTAAAIEKEFENIKNLHLNDNSRVTMKLFVPGRANQTADLGLVDHAVPRAELFEFSLNTVQSPTLLCELQCEINGKSVRFPFKVDVQLVRTGKLNCRATAMYAGQTQLAISENRGLSNLEREVSYNDLLEWVDPIIEDTSSTATTAPMQELTQLRSVIVRLTTTCAEQRDKKQMDSVTCSLSSSATHSLTTSTQMVWDALERRDEKYDRKSGTLEILVNDENGKKSSVKHKVISRKVDFVTEELPLVSIDIGITNREALTINPKTKVIATAIADAAKAVGDHEETKDFLVKASNHIAKAIYPSRDDSRINTMLRVAPSGAGGIKFIALEAFEKVGKCRHHAVTGCLILANAVKNNKLPPGSVHHYRGTAYNLNRHAFVVYKTTDTQHLFLFDSYTNAVFDLKVPAEAKAALAHFSKLKLEGVLAELYREHQIVHPAFDKIPVEVLDEVRLEDRTIRDEFDRKGMLCPISSHIMLEPVVAADGYIYDREYIEAYLAEGAKNPKLVSPATGKALEHRNLTAQPEHARAIWQLIQRHVRIRPESGTGDEADAAAPPPLPPRPKNRPDPKAMVTAALAKANAMTATEEATVVAVPTSYVESVDLASKLATELAKQNDGSNKRSFFENLNSLLNALGKDPKIDAARKTYLTNEMETLFNVINSEQSKELKLQAVETFKANTGDSLPKYILKMIASVIITAILTVGAAALGAFVGSVAEPGGGTLAGGVLGGAAGFAAGVKLSHSLFFKPSPTQLLVNDVIRAAKAEVDPDAAAANVGCSWFKCGGS